MLKAYSYSNLGQSLLDLGIKLGAAIIVLALNFISTAVSNGSIQLPNPALTVPVLGLILSQFDSWFVQWTKDNNIV